MLTSSWKILAVWTALAIDFTHVDVTLHPLLSSWNLTAFLELLVDLLVCCQDQYLVTKGRCRSEQYIFCSIVPKSYPPLAVWIWTTVVLKSPMKLESPILPPKWSLGKNLKVYTLQFYDGLSVL